MGNYISAAIFLPLIGFIITGSFGRFLPKNITGLIATLAVFVSFICSILLFNHLNHGGEAVKLTLFNWITAGNVNIDFSFLADKLSVWMMLIITGVGSLIHLYSIGYMHHDEGFYKFFAYLNLFIFSMLTLVLGANYVIMFFGWEGVGLCSYLLIGFWYANKEYGYAARKAFIMNRIGDLGLLIGIFILFHLFGTTDYQTVFAAASGIENSTLEILCILLFLGAIGKSAQIPLFTWLPDAMAGPTPVSALIHAATMVTAGIYLIARSSVLFVNAELASSIVLGIGLATAIIAATIGLKQNDIKKVLAYSTVSQLGYMFVALGVGAYGTALFHVTTHAFFKALLFLGSGSVIHAMSGEQDIRFMGGLSKKLKITHFTFLLGTLAITGIPPLAGFFSKDEILAKVYYGLPSGPIIFTLLAITSVLTAIYMFRLYFLTFHGKFRGTEAQAHHLHESPLTMTIPLMVLAVLSCIGGFLGLSSLFSHHHYIDHFFAKVLFNKEIPHPSHLFEMAVLIVSVVVLAMIIFATRRYYVTKENIPVTPQEETGVAKVLSNKYYLDEIYQTLILKPIEWISGFAYKIIDKTLIDGIVNLSGKGVNLFGSTLRKVQTGNIEFYLMAMVFGVISFLIIYQLV
jgi:NADH-quinone oxidoreductase subunit L